MIATAAIDTEVDGGPDAAIPKSLAAARDDT
jgi:hypothetical protein